jgi:hypothetical protein
MTSTPSLSSVSPTSYTANNTNQTMEVLGSNFVSGDTLTYVDPQGQVYANETAAYVSSTELESSFNNGDDPGTWTVKVNSASSSSSTVSFTVAAAAPVPSLSSVSPTSYTANNTNQTMEVLGSNFVSGDTLTYVDPQGQVYADETAAYVSSTELESSFNNGDDPGTWTVKVNSASSSSSTASFTVTGGSSAVDPFISYTDATPNQPTAADVVGAAEEYIGATWEADNCTGLVWAVSVAIGAPFYETVQTASNGLATSASELIVVPDNGYIVPPTQPEAGSSSNWTTFFSSDWTAQVQVGDLVRIPGTVNLGSTDPDSGHSFIVVGNSDTANPTDPNTWLVIDNTVQNPSGSTVQISNPHTFDNPGNTFDMDVLSASSAYISYLNGAGGGGNNTPKTGLDVANADYPWSTILDLASSLPTNYSFIGLYIGNESNYPTSEQISQLPANLQLVSIYEKDGMYDSYYSDGVATHTFDWESYLTTSQGESDAERACSAAQQAGQTSGCIYFAMDLDPTDVSQVPLNQILASGTANAAVAGFTYANAMNAIIAYFQGINDYFTSNKITLSVGVYGAGDVLQTILSNGLATYTWQAAATSWGATGPDANANITQGQQIELSVPVDPDTTSAAPFGAWGSSPISDSLAESVPSSPLNATAGVPQEISSVSVTDAGGGSDTFTTLITTANGGTVFASAAGGAVSGANTSSLTISGTLTQVNTALGTLTYSNASAVSDTVMVETSDPDATPSSVSESFGITVNAATPSPTTKPLGNVTTNLSGNNTLVTGGEDLWQFTVPQAETVDVTVTTSTIDPDFPGDEGFYDTSFTELPSTGSDTSTSTYSQAYLNAGTYYYAVENGDPSSKTYSITISTPVPASVTGSSFSVSEDQSVAITSELTLSNPNDDSVSYRFWDTGGSGHLSINGAAEAADQWINANAGNVSSVDFVGGSSAGSQTLYVQVFDANAGTWSPLSSITATTTVPASVTGSSFSIAEDQSVAITSELTLSNPNDDSVSYRFWDTGGSGHLSINGTAEAADQWINANAGNVGSVDFVGGSSAGSQTLYVQVFDANAGTWSPLNSFTATTTGNISGTLAGTKGTPSADFSSSDLLFLDTAGNYEVWQTNGTSVIGGGNVGTPGSGWTEKGTGDFNTGNKSDILFESSTGAFALWDMNGTSVTNVATFGSPGGGFNFVDIGNFDGTGNGDILFENTAGIYAMWQTNGTAVIGGGNVGSPGAGWSEVGIGDFNTGNTSDILFESTGGSYALWDMSGTTVSNVVTLGSPGAGWNFVAVGNFDGTGQGDILFENTAGDYAIWETNGTSVIGGGNLGSPGSAWSFAAIGDYNGDGKSDILFQNTTGGATSYAAWEMNGATIANVATFGSPGAGWTLQHTG